MAIIRGREPFLLYILTGAKPTVQLKDIIHHLVERMGLEIKRVPGVPERTVIERKPKLKHYINVK